MNNIKRLTMIDITDKIIEVLGITGRMISASKSRYIEDNPNGKPIFNANIAIEGEGKVWYGDIDVVKDEIALSTLYQIIGKPLYIFHEYDYRFENEDKPLIEVLNNCNRYYVVTDSIKEVLK